MGPFIAQGATLRERKKLQKWKAGNNPSKSRWGCYLPVLTRLASITPAPTFRGAIWWVWGRKARAAIDPFGRLAYLDAMAIQPIITLPDEKTLRQISKPVGSIDNGVRTLWDDMLETMYKAPGIGLAAIQLGVPRRMLVFDISKDGEERRPFFVANPEIVWKSEELSDYEEGCLSIPDYFEMVQRPKEIKVQYRDRAGEPMEIHAGGILATVLQHEIDHLNGVLFIDHISKLKRDRVIKKFQKAGRLGKL
jgi:peptide deformylase